MNKLIFLGSFAAGGCVGSLVAWILTKRKYEKLADEEINSVKEEFAKETHILVVDEKGSEETKNDKKDVAKEYQNKLVENNYISYKKALDEVKNTAQSPEVIPPYPIEPDEQGESGFARETLIWYEGDGTLADESGKILDQPDEVVGLNNIDDFNKSDVIYVRNETEEVDYEVIRDPGLYSEAYSNPNYINTESDE